MPFWMRCPPAEAGWAACLRLPPPRPAPQGPPLAGLPAANRVPVATSAPLLCPTLPAPCLWAQAPQGAKGASTSRVLVRVGVWVLLLGRKRLPGGPPCTWCRPPAWSSHTHLHSSCPRVHAHGGRSPHRSQAPCSISCTAGPPCCPLAQTPLATPASDPCTAWQRGPAAPRWAHPFRRSPPPVVPPQGLVPVITAARGRPAPPARPPGARVTAAVAVCCCWLRSIYPYKTPRPQQNNAETEQSKTTPPKAAGLPAAAVQGGKGAEAGAGQGSAGTGRGPELRSGAPPAERAQAGNSAAKHGCSIGRGAARPGSARGRRPRVARRRPAQAGLRSGGARGRCPRRPARRGAEAKGSARRDAWHGTARGAARRACHGR
jgi:hypothetical protein